MTPPHVSSYLPATTKRPDAPAETPSVAFEEYGTLSTNATTASVTTPVTTPLASAPVVYPPIDTTDVLQHQEVLPQILEEHNTHVESPPSAQSVAATRTATTAVRRHQGAESSGDGHSQQAQRYCCYWWCCCCPKKRRVPRCTSCGGC
eukprot:6419196-Pyramimonas_sp.AAC.1